MKLWVKNTILAVILVLIIAVPLLFMGGHDCLFRKLGTIGRN